MAVLIFTIGTMAAQSDAKADLVVDFIDVGQGDAELLRSGGEAMLIDTGTPESGTAVSSTVGEYYKYVKNTNTLRFHMPQCDSVKDMKEKNKEYSNQTREEIIAEGYKPCDRCRP